VVSQAQYCLSLRTIAPVTETMRMPMSVASRNGISAVAAIAEDRRVLLTSHGRTVAVVDSAERMDADMRILRDAAFAVIDAAANLVSARSHVSNLSEVCEHLGLDEKAVRTRAASRRSE